LTRELLYRLVFNCGNISRFVKMGCSASKCEEEKQKLRRKGSSKKKSSQGSSKVSQTSSKGSLFSSRGSQFSTASGSATLERSTFVCPSIHEETRPEVIDAAKCLLEEQQQNSRAEKVAKEENASYHRKLHFLSQVPLLKRLPRDQHPILAAAVQQCEFDAGDVVIKQGDSGSEFFMIRAGEASVHIQKDLGDPTQVATLRRGDYFGEHALLRDEPRAATVLAISHLSTYMVSREKFQSLGLHEKLQFVNRKAVVGNNHGIVTKKPSPKTDKERALIGKALKSNRPLQTMVSLSDYRVRQLTDMAWKEEVEAGKELITRGDPVANYMYIVQAGRFEIHSLKTSDFAASIERALSKGNTKRKSALEESLYLPEAVISDDEEEVVEDDGHLGFASAGDSFGELALLHLAPRKATVTAVVDSTVWVIDRGTFKRVLLEASSEKLNEYIRYLDRLEILTPLFHEEKRAVARALVEMHFTLGEAICQQGEFGQAFYILYQGEVGIIKDGETTNRLQASLAAGTVEFFGERALLTQEPRAATVLVTSESAKVLALDRDTFVALLGPLEDIIAKSRAGRQESMLQGLAAPAGPAGREQTKILREELTRIGLLGCGGFGVVELCEHRTTGETYALKSIGKGYIVKGGMQDAVISEKNILFMTNSPFIIRAFATFNSPSTLYFLLEAALGGDVHTTYNRRGFYGSDEHARFYVGSVVYAFAHLHERHILHRDLKPENLLLSADGYAKLADMGLAKFAIGKTYTTCGTPDYFAPEIIASTGHTVAVDWWMLGIMCFELLAGHSPFEAAGPMETYAKVLHGIDCVPFGPRLQGFAEELIRSLLRAEPCERLPMRPGGIARIQGCRWYTASQFEWQALESHAMVPPFTPKVRSRRDLSNFSAVPSDVPAPLPYRPDGTGWDKDFAST